MKEALTARNQELERRNQELERDGEQRLSHMQKELGYSREEEARAKEEQARVKGELDAKDLLQEKSAGQLVSEIGRLTKHEAEMANEVARLKIMLKEVELDAKAEKTDHEVKMAGLIASLEHGENSIAQDLAASNQRLVAMQHELGQSREEIGHLKSELEHGMKEENHEVHNLKKALAHHEHEKRLQLAAVDELESRLGRALEEARTEVVRGLNDVASLGKELGLMKRELTLEKSRFENKERELREARMELELCQVEMKTLKEGGAHTEQIELLEERQRQQLEVIRLGQEEARASLEIDLDKAVNELNMKDAQLLEQKAKLEQEKLEWEANKNAEKSANRLNTEARVQREKQLEAAVAEAVQWRKEAEESRSKVLSEEEGHRVKMDSEWKLLEEKMSQLALKEENMKRESQQASVMQSENFSKQLEVLESKLVAVEQEKRELSDEKIKVVEEKRRVETTLETQKSMRELMKEKETHAIELASFEEMVEAFLADKDATQQAQSEVEITKRTAELDRRELDLQWEELFTERKSIVEAKAALESRPSMEAYTEVKSELTKCREERDTLQKELREANHLGLAGTVKLEAELGSELKAAKEALRRCEEARSTALRDAERMVNESRKDKEVMVAMWYEDSALMANAITRLVSLSEALSRELETALVKLPEGEPMPRQTPQAWPGLPPSIKGVTRQPRHPSDSDTPTHIPSGSAAPWRKWSSKRRMESGVSDPPWTPSEVSDPLNVPTGKATPIATPGSVLKDGEDDEVESEWVERQVSIVTQTFHLSRRLLTEAFARGVVDASSLTHDADQERARIEKLLAELKEASSDLTGNRDPARKPELELRYGGLVCAAEQGYLLQVQCRDEAVALQCQIGGAIEALSPMWGQIEATSDGLSPLRRYEADTREVTTLREKLRESGRREAELKRYLKAADTAEVMDAHASQLLSSSEVTATRTTNETKSSSFTEAKASFKEAQV